MNFFLQVTLLALIYARSTLQIPVGGPESSTSTVQLPKEADLALLPLERLLDIRPNYIRANRGTLFKEHFANHRDIKALDKLTEQDLVTEVINLRKDVAHNSLAKRRFRQAMREYLNARQISKEARTAIENRFDMQNRQQANSSSQKRHIEKNGDQLRESKKKQERLRKMLRSLDFNPTKYFEEQMVAHGIPYDSSAKDIEEKSRKFFYPTNKMATSHLKEYLQTRFSKFDVDNAAASRSSTNRKETRIPSHNNSRRMLKSGSTGEAAKMKSVIDELEPYMVPTEHLNEMASTSHATSSSGKDHNIQDLDHFDLDDWMNHT